MQGLRIVPGPTGLEPLLVAPVRPEGEERQQQQGCEYPFHLHPGASLIRTSIGEPHLNRGRSALNPGSFESPSIR